MITQEYLEKYSKETVDMVISRLSQIVFPDLFDPTQYNGDERTLTCYYELPNGIKTIWDIKIENEGTIGFKVTFVDKDYCFSAVVFNSAKVNPETTLYKKLFSIFERIDSEQLIEDYEALVKNREIVLDLLGDKK